LSKEDPPTTDKDLKAQESNPDDYNPQMENIDDYIEGIEKKIILDTLEKNRWNRTHAAKVLGITFRSLRYRLKKLGIDSDE